MQYGSLNFLEYLVFHYTAKPIRMGASAIVNRGRRQMTPLVVVANESVGLD